MVRQRINVEIDELVLDGFTALEGKMLGSALKNELAHLITQNNLTSNLFFTKQPSVDIPSLSLELNSEPIALCQNLAQHILKAAASDK